LRIMIDSADCVLPAIIRPLRHWWGHIIVS
jgi:hypothetical protein